MTEITEQADRLHAMRHSLAHILATAIQELYPDAKFGVGPVVEHGFYYDVEVKPALVAEDLPKLEAKMREVVAADYPFVRTEEAIATAITRFTESQQPYKVELLTDLKVHGTTVAKDIDREQLGVDPLDKVDAVSLYTNGLFTDLCRGPHVESTGQVGAFKLMRLSGAYWRGSEKNPQLQRIYGVGFTTESELAEYLERLDEAERRDHRKLGQELDLFFMHETSPGMPYWLPKGARLFNELAKFWREEHEQRGYQEIISPLINKKELYQTSGHFDHFWGEMYVSEPEPGEDYAVKPMNCPNAMVVYGSRPHSYRELPLRYADMDVLHRYELSGTLHGLLRTRSFTQDDAHIFVSEDQVHDEYIRILEIVERFYSIFSLNYSFRLGTRPDGFLGDQATWDKAEHELKKILESSDRDYVVLEGDGAFYGPKIDILMKDVLGREWQMGTIQLDFQQPKRFGLTYTDKDGQLKTPVAIHRVIYGSFERFIAILIEHFAGAFPVWLAPEQVRLVTVNDSKSIVKWAQNAKGQMQAVGLRAELDDSNESVGKKIRAAELAKVPYTIVVGEQEVANAQVAPRVRKDLVGKGEQEGQTLALDEFISQLAEDIRRRESRSSFQG